MWSGWEPEFAGTALVVNLLLSAGGGVPVSARAGTPATVPAASALHVRPLVHGSQDARPLMADAIARSETVRRLVAELEASDVIVWIELMTRTGGGPYSCLRWMGAAGGVRRVHVAIDPTLDPDMRVEQLGHELQHAVEISRERGVQNVDLLRRLYQRIGTAPAYAPNHFETDAAIAVAKQVRRDLCADAAASRRR